jgi:hypothetical protein
MTTEKEQPQTPPPDVMLSPRVDKICPALIKAQQNIKTITKTKTVALGGSRGYKYAPLENLIEEALPKLNANDIALTQIIWPDAQGRDKLWSILLHTSGQWIASQYPLNLKDGANAHAIGSAITYARKYTLGPQAGLAVQDEDDDAGQAVAQKEQRRQANHQPQTPRPDSRYVGQE